MSCVPIINFSKQALPGGPKHHKRDRDCSIVTDTRNITTVAIQPPASFRSKSCEIGGQHLAPK